MTSDPNTSLAMLRHTVATLAYRGGKAVRGAPAGFERFQAAPGTRMPVEILAHIGDLLDWAVSLADGAHQWHDSAPLPWDQEIARFFAGLDKLDQRLSSGTALGNKVEEIFQGPIADAFTHVGQISMLRRLAGAPVRAENYFRAEIVAGRVGPEQAKPGKEF
ncbi:MAG: hypothetical protein ACR2NN_22455 [Bryobacteraceae bacterium]